MTCFMQMCVLPNSQTYGGVGNSVCYGWQEPDGVARVDGAKRSSIVCEARAEGEAWDEAGEGSGERAQWAPTQKNFENSNLK